MEAIYNNKTLKNKIKPLWLKLKDNRNNNNNNNNRINLKINK